MKFRTGGDLKPTRIIFLLIVLALACGKYIYSHRQNDPVTQSIPPKENADGTIDYTLLSQAPQSTAHYWVLRFPKTMAVTRSEEQYEGVVTLPNGPSYKLKSQPNENIEFFLRLPTLEPLPAPATAEDIMNAGVLRVYVYNHPYNIKARLPEMMQDIAEKCVEVGRFEPGVIAYQAKPDYQAPKDRPGKCFVHDLGDDKAIGYILHDRGGAYLGDFKCWLPQTPDAQAGCFGNIALPQNRRALFHFMTVKIPPQSLQSITEQVVKFVTQATIRLEAIPAK
jgi:hypothetical protein